MQANPLFQRRPPTCALCLEPISGGRVSGGCAACIEWLPLHPSCAESLKPPVSGGCAMCHAGEGREEAEEPPASRPAGVWLWLAAFVITGAGFGLSVYRGSRVDAIRMLLVPGCLYGVARCLRACHACCWCCFGPPR